MRYFLFIFLPISCLAQHSHIEDFNLDGQLDSLFWERSSGSQFCSSFIGVYDKASGVSVEIYSESSFSNFLSVYGLSSIPSYGEKAWTRIFELAFSPAPLDEPEPSLDWLITAYQNFDDRDTALPLTDIFQVPPVWNDGLSKTPKVRLRYIEGETLQQFRKSHFIAGDTKSKAAMIVYYGHNHGRGDGLKRINEDFRGGQLIKSMHGLIWLKDGKSCWVLAHDRGLFRGPTKLRWESVNEVFIYEDLLLVSIQSPIMMEQRMLLLHPESGLIATLDIQYDLMPSEIKYALAGSQFRIISRGQVQNFDLDDLKKVLLTNRE